MYGASVLSRCCICCTSYTRMLQVYISNILAVSNICCECVCLDVAYVAVAIHICCKRMFVNVSFVSDVCCIKCFMLQVLHDQAPEVAADGGGPLVRAGSEVGATAPHACVGACVPQQQARQQQRAATTWTGATAACRRAGKSCMHALWDLPRQSGRRRRGARVPSVGRMHPGKCVACVVSCRYSGELLLSLPTPTTLAKRRGPGG